MMNLIGNTCIPCWITTHVLKQQLVNPFSWCIMEFDSCYNLVKNFDKIDWYNYEIVKDKNWKFSIILDHQIKIDYVHYLFDAKCAKLTKCKNSADIRYNKIWNYINECYLKRVKRMLELNIKPIFVFTVAKALPKHRSNFTEEQIKKLIDLHSPYKIILSFPHTKNIERIENIVFIAQENNNKNMGVSMATEIYNKAKTLIEI